MGGYSAAAAPKRNFLAWNLGSFRLSLLPLLGGIAVAVSSVLPWFSGNGNSVSSYKFAFKFLWDYNAGSGFKLGIVVVALGAVAAVLSLVPIVSPLRRLLGFASTAVAVAYIVSLGRGFSDHSGSFTDGFTNAGAGTWMCLAAGLLVAASK
jgi:hypothetical protein